MKYVHIVINWAVTWWIIQTFGAVGATVNGVVMGLLLGAALTLNGAMPAIKAHYSGGK